MPCPPPLASGFFPIACAATFKLTGEDEDEEEDGCGIICGGGSGGGDGVFELMLLLPLPPFPYPFCIRCVVGEEEVDEPPSPVFC